MALLVGIFDRSQPLPTGGELEQADGTAWMAFFCVVMLDISLELAMHSYQHTSYGPHNSFQHDPVYEDMASKFFEHFVLIADAMNKMGECDGHQGLWDDKDGFYYDCLRLDGQSQPMRVRSMVGLIPLFACLVLEDEVIQKLPGFKKRLTWFLTYRPDLAKQVSQSLVCLAVLLTTITSFLVAGFVSRYTQGGPVLSFVGYPF